MICDMVSWFKRNLQLTTLYAHAGSMVQIPLSAIYHSPHAESVRGVNRGDIRGKCGHNRGEGGHNREPHSLTRVVFENNRYRLETIGNSYYNLLDVTTSVYDTYNLPSVLGPLDPVVNFPDLVPRHGIM